MELTPGLSGLYDTLKTSYNYTASRGKQKYDGWNLKINEFENRHV